MNMTCYQDLNATAMFTCPAAAYPLLYPLILLAVWVILFSTVRYGGDQKESIAFASFAVGLLAIPLVILGVLNPVYALLLFTAAGLCMF